MYGINKLLHTKDPKTKTRTRGLCVVWVLLVGMAFTYIGGLVTGLCSLGLADIVPAYLTALASLLLLVFNLFSAGDRLFSAKGLDMLISLPLSPRSIVFGRFIGLYLSDLPVVLAIFLPGMAVYGYCVHPAFWVYLMALPVMLCIPAIPLVVASVFGTLLMALTSRMKHKSLAQSALSVLVVVGVMTLSFGAERMMADFTPEQFTALAEKVGDMMAQIYFPAGLVGKAMGQGNGLCFLFFLLLSVGMTAVALWVISRCFTAIISRLQTVSAKHTFAGVKGKRSGMLKALYIREAKRYFASSIYVSNTAMGPILALIMAVALWVSGPQVITDALPVSIDLPGLMPFVFSAVCGMMMPSTVSISMEGKQIGMVKSLPIPLKSLLDSKILFNLSLVAPFALLGEVFLFLALHPTLMQGVWLVLIPCSLISLVVVLGITVNLHFHSFDWEQEATVVKQSLPAAVGGFAGFFLSLVLGVAVFLIPAAYADVAKAGLCLLMWAVTRLLYCHNNRKQLVEL